MKQMRFWLLVTKEGELRQYSGESGEHAALRFVTRYPTEAVGGYAPSPKLTLCDIRGEDAMS